MCDILEKDNWLQILILGSTNTDAVLAKDTSDQPKLSAYDELRMRLKNLLKGYISQHLAI